MVHPHGRVGVLVQQVHGPDGVLEGQRDVAELLEHRREHEVTAGEGAAGVVVGGPAVHVLGDPAGLGDVAAAAEQVGLDELGAVLELGEAQLARRGHRLLGAVLGAAAVEPGEHLQLDHGRQQLAGARVVGDRRERVRALVGRRRRADHTGPSARRSVGLRPLAGEITPNRG